MRRNEISFWWIVPVLLVVFLVATVVTFCTEPKSNYIKETWKEPVAFTVLSDSQMVGVRTAAAQIEQSAKQRETVTARLSGATTTRSADSCTCPSEWHPAQRICRAPTAERTNHIIG